MPQPQTIDHLTVTGGLNVTARAVFTADFEINSPAVLRAMAVFIDQVNVNGYIRGPENSVWIGKLAESMPSLPPGHPRRVIPEERQDLIVVGNITGRDFTADNITAQKNVTVTGDIILTNADCAEEFAIKDVEMIEPGTVMVLGEEGSLHQSTKAYDKKVAGVISGAGDLKPGLILDKQPEATHRMPISLMGKVYCKVDAQYAPIEVGDLLTTSSTPGHAMKAKDPLMAFGTVIGKALRPLAEGKALIPILVALQ